ncbi:MAG: hypothetical protein MUF84_02385 [Anaerolineae bacterium]|nr:hypothetical protein [Anaerolineae bacterium]
MRIVREAQVAREQAGTGSELMGEPVDRGYVAVGDEQLRWSYVRCLDDHFVDLSTFRHNWTYLRAWAYTRLSLFDPAEATFVLTTNGPADVWINGEHIHRHEHFHHQDPQSVSFPASLRADDNEILVRFEEVAARECPYAMALAVQGEFEAEDVVVKIPSATERTVRHMMLERVFEQACIEGVASHRGKVVNLHWADDLEANFNYQYSIQGPDNRLYLSGEVEAKPGEVVDVGHGFRIRQGPFRVVLRPVGPEYYNYNIRYQWDIPLTILDNEFSEAPYGTMAERSREALEYAATQKNDLYAEIAKFALARWAEVDEAVVLNAIESINRRGDCSDFYLVGLLGAVARYADQDSFPGALRTAIRECALAFKYWHDEPGTDAMCYTTENHSILFHTCEVLAGQLYPDAAFSNTGEAGQWHRQKGEALAKAWLKQRGGAGFWEWDSNCYFEEDALALSHLAGLAEDETIAELAAVVLDKLLFTMAVNSYKGVFGSTHGRTYAPQIKSGQLESTSGISRLLWGMGIFNQNLRGLVGMACSEYEFPLMIAQIAADLPDEMWNRECHEIDESGNAIHKVTYKTPDTMLASVQDFRPGEKGYQQHIWQATFGPDAVVFVSHPPCVSENGAHRPNFWSGNYVLPRVAQWKDVLIALHDLPQDDWLGFTHAYFPVYAFDETAVRENWAFARKGDGYLALGSSLGLELIKRGPAAYSELRSYGRKAVWVCQMGRAALDGDFAAFQERVLGLPLTVEGLSVTFETLRGDVLSFGWQTPFLRNGQGEPLRFSKHYDNPYCSADLHAPTMDVQLGEYVMRLEF